MSSGDNGFVYSLVFLIVFWIYILVCFTCEGHAIFAVDVYVFICVVSLRYTPISRDLLCDLGSPTLFWCHGIICHPSKLSIHKSLWWCISSAARVLVRRFGRQSFQRCVRTWLAVVCIYGFLVFGNIGSILLVPIAWLLYCWLWFLIAKVHTFPGGSHSKHTHCSYKRAGCIITSFHLVSGLPRCASILCVPLAFPNRNFNVAAYEFFVWRWHHTVK